MPRALTEVTYCTVCTIIHPCMVLTLVVEWYSRVQLTSSSASLWRTGRWPRCSRTRSAGPPPQTPTHSIGWSDFLYRQKCSGHVGLVQQTLAQ